MVEILANIVKTAVISEATSHPEEVLDIAGDIIEFAGDCVCDILEGIGSLFD
ncbi:MAG: hypothetical protein MJY93_01600 [Fibrobacter sp.]|nr:hypothetical protein [Fibrobacter sp.]